MNNNFLKKIYNKDIIYHYTKASAAIDFILYYKQLQFCQARKSFDPIEGKKPRRCTVSYKAGSTADISEQQYKDENELHNFLDIMEERFNQICFCKNNIGEDFSSTSCVLTFGGNEELLGFAKPRMWDQYADKFSGCALHFQKKKC